MADDNGLTLRDLVLEVRTDVKELKNDLTPRVVVLEKKAIETEAVATALNSEKKERWTTREKLLGIGFALVTMILNVMALGPDVIN
jgi:hypothetical protein